MKKTILTMMAVMVFMGSIGANIFMSFQISKLNHVIETNSIKEEQTYVSPARYTFGGQIYTEDGHEFIYDSESYDKICPIDGTPYKIEDDRVITIWEDKEELTSILEKNN